MNADLLCQRHKAGRVQDSAAVGDSAARLHPKELLISTRESRDTLTKDLTLITRNRKRERERERSGLCEF